MIKTPIQGSVQSLVKKCAKSANLPLMTDFKVVWPQRGNVKSQRFYKSHEICMNSVLDIEITSWEARAYGIFTRVGEVSEIERVSAANE